MRILITGGAGFTGGHATDRYAAEHAVTAFDDLSRRGTDATVEWLRTRRRFTFVRGDVRDAAAVREAVANARPDVVLHLAAQVAVTTSVADPRLDFDVNAGGTLNVLEAVRRHAPDALVIYSSTNKVYGGLEGLTVATANGRYQFADRPHGIGEDQPLDFHSPYGCSKGAADQYVRDYARIYGLKTVVFRQSCVYGTRQFGVEDQGWVAWFAVCAAAGRPVTLYGDGRQVRDVLWIDDLLDVYDAAIARPAVAAGRVYNMGGGPANQLSLLECLGLIERSRGRPVERRFGQPRPGDQRVFVADTRRAERDFGWAARTTPAEGIERLVRWVTDNQPLLRT